MTLESLVGCVLLYREHRFDWYGECAPLGFSADQIPVSALRGLDKFLNLEKLLC